jgi:hypothetical protein
MRENKYRIATTEAGLEKGLLWVRGVQIPQVAPYRGHSVIVGKSDGSNQEYGFKNVTMMWERLTYYEGFVLKTLVEAARNGSGLLFLTIDRSDGDKPGRDWIDVSGFPGHLVMTGAAPLNRNGQGTYDNVQLTVNNLTILNDPSSYST